MIDETGHYFVLGMVWDMNIKTTFDIIKNFNFFSLRLLCYHTCLPGGFSGGHKHRLVQLSF